MEHNLTQEIDCYQGALSMLKLFTAGKCRSKRPELVDDLLFPGFLCCEFNLK